MKKKAYYLFLTGIMLFVVFLRVFQLDQIPLSMHIDEAGLGLNAWSVANYGTDRYGNVLPVCPINFYGEQSAFYTYFCAVLIKVFGLSIYTLRMPAVIMGVLAVWFGALIFKEKWGEKGQIIGLVLMGIFPYFIMNSRFALDCNAMLGMITIALYALTRLMNKVKENPREKYYVQFALTGVLFGLVLYTYIIAALVIVVFCVLFGCYYLFCHKENRKLCFLQLTVMAIPMIVMVIPLCLVVCVNYFGLEPIETSFMSVPKLAVNRTEEVAFSFSALPSKIKGLIHTLTTDGKYGSSDNYWTLYRFSVPFVILGGILSVYDGIKGLKNKEWTIEAGMLFLIIAESIMFLLCGLYNYHINGIFIALAFLCLKGIWEVYGFIKKHSLKYLYAGILTGVYLLSFIGFATEYFGTDETRTYQVYDGAGEAVELLGAEQKAKQIYILDEVGEFYFLTNPIPPSEFAQSCDELGYIKEYGNMRFDEPEILEEESVYVCQKGSRRYDRFVLEHGYSVKETKHYYVFYK